MACAATTLTAVPPKVGGIALRLVQAAIFVTGFARCLRSLVPEWPASRVGWAFAVAAFILAPAVNNGQLNVLIAGSLLHAGAAVRVGRDSEAALWLTLAGWVKLYPFAVAMLLCLVRPWLAPRLVMVIALGAVLPYVAQSYEVVSRQYQEYWHYLGDDDRTYAHLVRVPRDWTCWPRMVLGVIVPSKVALGVSLVAAGGMALLTLRLAWRGEGVAAALILGGTWMTTFGPATEANTYSLLAGTAALALWLAPPTWPRRVAWVGVILLLAPAPRGAFPEDWKFTAYGPQALGAALTAVGFCFARGRRVEPG